MAEIRIENLKVTYTNKKNKSEIIGLNDFSYTFKDKQFTAIMGPSGCGKTTLLKSLINRVDYDSGDIFLDNVDIDKIPLNQRNFAYLSQDVVLYKTKTVFNNIAFPITNKKYNKDEIRQMVYDIAEELNITNLLNRKVSYLSKGQQQIVNFAKALIKNPNVILMDEPFSNLDSASKLTLKKYVKSYYEKNHPTIIFVSHDESDAYQLSEYVILLDEGNIVKEGLSRNILNASISLDKEKAKEETVKTKGYKEPVTRKEQFFDIVRNHFASLSTIGALLIVFSMLLFFIIIVKQRVLEPTLYEKLMLEQGYSKESIPMLYVKSTAIYDAIEIPCIMVSALGFAGMFRAIRRMIWNEGVLVFRDFFEGIKLYWKKFLLTGFIIGIFLLIINFASGVLTVKVNANLGTAIEIAFKVLFLIMVFPIMTIMLVNDTYFKVDFKNNFKNGCVLYVRSLAIFVLLSLCLAPLVLISLVENFYLLMIILAITFVVIIPLLVLAWHSHSNYLFDQYIEFPDNSYKNKGLFKDKITKSNGGQI